MAIPEKISEALIETDINMKSFRKSMLVMLFEWQNLETRLDLTQKCFNESFPLEDSASQITSSDLADLGSFKSSVESKLVDFEQKDRDFREFQENGFKEMAKREEKLGFLRKEICLREKKVEEQEGLIEMERRQIEFERKSIDERLENISEKEKFIEQCLKENESKEEEFARRVKEFELKEKDFEMMKKDLLLSNSKEKFNPSTGSAVFRIAGPSNQSMALVNVSETKSVNQQISKRRLRSKAWLHFTKIVKGEGSADKCRCNYCHREFALCGGGTSQLLRHISEGRCLAYQERNSALPIDEMLGQTNSQQFVDVQIEEQLTMPSNVGEDTRTPLVERFEESLKQEPATFILEPEVQTQPHTEPQMAIPRTCDIQNTAICEDNYQPQQSKDLSENHSDPSFDQQPLWTGNSGFPPLSGSSMSLANGDNIIRMGDSDGYCQDPLLSHKGNTDINKNASGDTSEEFQMFTCQVEKTCSSGDQRSQNRKREREHIVEQNESSNIFLHSDIEDLPSPLRKHSSSNLSTYDNENTEDVLHEVDPVSCIIPDDPAQELNGHMMNQKDLTHEGSMPE
ncbi:hypothetical protein Leryth_022630 [Lithospermum erythrorhizon]|nr:hypothetical protein Leryth_022630 [Lithospermum erythrorhizon]